MKDLSFRRPLIVAVVTIIVAVAVVIGLTTGGGGGGGASTAASTPARRPDKPSTGSFLNAVIPSAAAAAGEARAVNRALAVMPDERKVATVFLWGLDARHTDAQAIRVLRGRGLGGVALTDADPSQVPGLARSLGSSSPGGPLLLAAQVGGIFNAVRGPPPSAPTDVGSAAAAAREATGAARTLRRAGIDGVLAPDLDVGPPDNPAVGERAFSESARATAQFGRAVVDAYGTGGMFAAPSHFPGLGSASQPVEDGPANVGSSKRELAKSDLVPFRAAIDAGAPGIVISNGLYVYDDFVTPGSLSHAVMVDVLRNQLGFRGVAITGDLTDPGVTALAAPARAAVAALKAGADLLYLSGPPTDQQAAYRAVLAAVRTKAVKRTRLDEAVRRVLTVKGEYGR